MKSRKGKQQAQSSTPRVVGFFARLYVLRPDEGGRSVPIGDGYRVQGRFTADQPWDNDVGLQLEGQETCAPGEECTARLQFGVPDAVTETVMRGSSFVLREGPNVVARGTVLEVVYSSDTA